MKGFKILLALLVVLFLACGIYWGIYQYDLNAHTGTVELQTALSIQDPGTKGITPGETVGFQMQTLNSGYSALAVRQSVVLSVYSPDGTPLILDGTAWTSASLDLEPAPNATRILWSNHAAYTTEYTVGPCERAYAMPFIPDPFDGSNTTTSDWSVLMDMAASTEYANSIIVVDVHMESAPAENPQALQTISHETIVFGADAAPAQHHFPAAPVSAAEYTGYQWENRNGWAYLVDIGSVLEPDIVIPPYVSLTEINGQYYEDPLCGTAYPVIVAGDAFYDCDTLHTVSIQPGVVIENNQMAGDTGGMFEKCDNLANVINIPETVQSMTNTFSDCTSLIRAPVLPESLTDLSGCFRGCTALTFVDDIPQNVVNMYQTFADCTALASAPALPEKLVHMTYCFDGCTQLEEAPAIPDTVTDLNNSFRNCTSLVCAPVIPDSVVSLKDTFSGCSALTEVPYLSASLTNMQGAFRNCTSLVQIPDLPGSLTNMKESFLGCSSLTFCPDIPEGVTNLFRTFTDCTSLISAPYLPDSAEDLRYCFSGCTSLSGAVCIPNLFPEEFAYLYRFESIAGIVDGCTELDLLQIRYCDGRIDPEKFSKDIPVEFVGAHQDGTLCPICRFANLTTEIDGVTIVIDDIQKDQYELFMDNFENKIPDWLKAYCASMTLTDDLNRYSSNYKGPTVQGFATYPDGDTYIKNVINYSRPEIPYIMFHELAHTYDTRYSSSTRYVSGTDEWISIHAEEGDRAADAWYSKSYYDLPLFKKRSESFAMALGKYFTDAPSLQQRCPRMYEYIQNLVEENQS